MRPKEERGRERKRKGETERASWLSPPFLLDALEVGVRRCRRTRTGDRERRASALSFSSFRLSSSGASSPFSVSLRQDGREVTATLPRRRRSMAYGNEHLCVCVIQASWCPTRCRSRCVALLPLSREGLDRLGETTTQQQQQNLRDDDELNEQRTRTEPSPTQNYELRTRTFR